MYCFDFKKILKYLFIILVCFIIFNSSSVFASTNGKIANLVTVDSRDIIYELYKGNEENLIAYYNENWSSNLPVTYSADIKNYIATQLGYTTFDNFKADYYYIIGYFVSANATNHGMSAVAWARPKSDGKFDLTLSVDSGTRSTPSASYSTNIKLGPSVSSSDLSSFTFGGVNISSYSFTGNNYGAYLLQFSCASGSTCDQSWNSSTNTMNINFYKYTSTAGHPLFYDSNYAFNFNFNQSLFTTSSNYFYDTLKINNTDTYSFGDTIAETTIIPSPNINVIDADTTSYNANYILLGYSPVSAGETISCNTYNDNSRAFSNGVCYSYSSDMSNTLPPLNFGHYTQLFISDFTFNVSNYYVFTFRTYSNYSFNINSMSVFVDNYSYFSRGFDYFETKIYDYSLYRDYQIVFKLPLENNLSTGNIKSISLTFDNISNFTDDIGDNYSFGIFKTYKLSKYTTQPSSNDLLSDYNDNSLDSISSNSTSSFFSNFRINDRGLSQFVLLPLNFISNFKNTTCSPISLPFPHLTNMTLPCISTLISSKVPVIWNFYVVLINGFVIYRILINLFGDIKNIYKPDNDRIEVLDL